jgi:hypothetical protein
MMRRLHTDVFEGLAVTQSTGVAAVGGWSHAARTRQARVTATRRLPKNVVGERNLHPCCGEIVVYRHR